MLAVADLEAQTQHAFLCHSQRYINSSTGQVQSINVANLEALLCQSTLHQ